MNETMTGAEFIALMKGGSGRSGSALVLPYPPSANHYWRHVGPKVLISKQGRDYRKAVEAAAFPVGAPQSDRLSVKVRLFPPDRRRRDLDNTLKPLLDACTHAGLWLDDSQIDELTIVRGEVVPEGKVLLTVRELP